MPLFKLRIAAADLAAGIRAEALLLQIDTPEAIAVTLFEDAPGRFVVEAYYPTAPTLAPIAQALSALGAGLGRPALEEVADANWVALSQGSLPPIRAGRFLVHGSHDRERIGLRNTAIEIEAGEAFGTAHNATTALCLEAIDRLTRGRSFARVLDLGCGTGILAIAVARAQPAAQVLASDCDRLATAIARANARLNRVGRRVRVIDAASFDHALLRAAAPFDLVLANMLPGALIKLAPHMRRRIRPGGIAVLSGMLNHQAREVGASYRAAGLRLLERLSRGGWTALALARR
jgi:ribosomal protein L11 methyltransferase